MNKHIPHDTTKLFCDIFEDAETFLEEWKDSGIYESTTVTRQGTDIPVVTDDNITLLYYLLYSRYANNSIANLDENQFKYKVWAIIFQYGPTWQKRLTIQNNIRNLSDEDLVKGSKAINSHALAMGDETMTAYTDPTNIDVKTGTYYEKPILEAYSNLIDLLSSDVTGEFLDRFKNLFAKFVYTRPDLYITEYDED